MSFLHYLVVALIGILVGITELINRYRDAPSSTLTSAPAFLYLGLNALASLTALLLTETFKIDFGLGATENLAWIQVLASGFSAMAIFRSSFFVVRVGDQDIGIGPSSLLQIVLGSVDRAVDRVRARNRAEEVAKIMKDISFKKAYPALSAYCLALMQNLSEEDQDLLGEDLKALAKAPMDEEIKVLNMGLALMNAVGPNVLRVAVETLSSRIKD